MANISCSPAAVIVHSNKTVSFAAETHLCVFLCFIRNCGIKLGMVQAFYPVSFADRDVRCVTSLGTDALPRESQFCPSC